MICYHAGASNGGAAGGVVALSVARQCRQRGKDTAAYNLYPSFRTRAEITGRQRGAREDETPWCSTALGNNYRFIARFMGPAIRGIEVFRPRPQ